MSSSVRILPKPQTKRKGYIIDFSPVERIKRAYQTKESNGKAVWKDSTILTTNGTKKNSTTS